MDAVDHDQNRTDSQKLNHMQTLQIMDGTFYTLSICVQCGEDTVLTSKSIQTLAESSDNYQTYTQRFSIKYLTSARYKLF